MKKKLIIGGIGVVIVGWIAYAVFAHRGTSYQFVTVTQGPITQVVSVTGNTTPAQSLDLGFQSGGTIAAVNYQAGASVRAGAVIASLSTEGLQAQLAQAQADVAQEQAKLSSLQTGPTPQSVEVSQAQLGESQQTLANAYAAVSDTLSDAYAKAFDAVEGQLSGFFTNPQSVNPQLAFSVSDPQVVDDTQFGFVKSQNELTAWQTELVSLNTGSASGTLDTSLQEASAHLSVIKTFLNAAAQALIDNQNLSSSTLAAHQTAVTQATTEANEASSEVNTAIQGIASDEASVAQLQAELQLTLASSTPQDIAAQQAAVEAAQANVQNVQAEIDEASIVSPITGVVTTQNAKVGEIASPGTTLVSIISNNNFEVDADVPETDIGKVSVGNPVVMTLDAFPGETFNGKVFYINPAETLISGVVDYEVKVSFDKADPRLKSGLTANLDIQTQTDSNALILPQFAIIQNASGTFVEVVKNNAATQVPVTLGIEDQNGNVEITNGVTAGEQVVNIGLKSQ